jgi:hypothetical protein
MAWRNPRRRVKELRLRRLDLPDDLVAALHLDHRERARLTLVQRHPSICASPNPGLTCRSSPTHTHVSEAGLQRPAEANTKRPPKRFLKTG